MKTLSFLAAAAVSLAAAACGASTAEQPAATTAAPPSLTVAAETLATTFAAEGTVRARHRADISTRLMARVRRR